MADSFSKKEREKKKAKRKKEKEERKEERRAEGKQTEVFMYVDSMGNFTETKPEAVETSLESIAELNDNKRPKNKNINGTVKFVDPEKGFGFIQTNGKWGDVYFNIPRDNSQITLGTKVEFEIEKTERGARAVNIAII